MAKYLRYQDLKPLKGIPFSRQHIRRLQKALKFPLSVPLGDNTEVFIDEEIDRWILALELVADTVSPDREVRAVHDDPDDDHLLAAALEGRAAFLVTGDQHVLALGEFEGVRIVTPAEFLKTLGES